jgi:hypothetical protein
VQLADIAAFLDQAFGPAPAVTPPGTR